MRLVLRRLTNPQCRHALPQTQMHTVKIGMLRETKTESIELDTTLKKPNFVTTRRIQWDGAGTGNFGISVNGNDWGFEFDLQQKPQNLSTHIQNEVISKHKTYSIRKRVLKKIKRYVSSSNIQLVWQRNRSKHLTASDKHICYVCGPLLTLNAKWFLTSIAARQGPNLRIQHKCVILNIQISGQFSYERAYPLCMSVIKSNLSIVYEKEFLLHSLIQTIWINC